MQDERADGENLSLTINKLFAKLALYAPDHVYLAVKEALIDRGIVFGRDVKPKIYSALRKALFGQNTQLECKDLVPHIEAKHIPQAEAEAIRNSARR
jgi:hypothetical protein